MNSWAKASPRFRAALGAELGQLFGAPEAPVVALVSGGLDSMLLAEALWVHEYPVHVLHVNYGLRGGASDADEAHVLAWAESKG